jgi:hypothetical protein
MFTATRSPRQADKPIDGLLSRRSLQSWLLILLVFFAGAVSLAIELSAARLFAPYFGTSLFVWANLIGFSLLYLTVGYYLGGIVADRHPRSGALYALALVAALFVALIPPLAPPLLGWLQGAFADSPIGFFYGSLLAAVVLFAIPTILLGAVLPFAIRLSMVQPGRSGRTAGYLLAISTTGSIVGTFFPVLVSMPYAGVALTFLGSALLLLLLSLAGLVAARLHG